MNRRRFLRFLSLVPVLPRLLSTLGTYRPTGWTIRMGNQIRKVVSYDPKTGVATVEKAWRNIPDAASTFKILR